jgi:hypothetical protein
MDLQMAEYIVERLQEEGYDASVRSNYIGRCMTTGVPAIVTDAPPVLIGFFAGGSDASDDPDGVTTEDVPTREDSLGLQRVYY